MGFFGKKRKSTSGPTPPVRDFDGNDLPAVPQGAAPSDSVTVPTRAPPVATPSPNPFVVAQTAAYDDEYVEPGPGVTDVDGPDYVDPDLEIPDSAAAMAQQERDERMRAARGQSGDKTLDKEGYTYPFGETPKPNPPGAPQASPDGYEDPWPEDKPKADEPAPVPGDYEPAWSDPGVELEEDDVSASGLNVAGMSVGAPSTVGTVARNQRLGYSDPWEGGMPRPQRHSEGAAATTYVAPQDASDDADGQGYEDPWPEQEAAQQQQQSRAAPHQSQQSTTPPPSQIKGGGGSGGGGGAGDQAPPKKTPMPSNAAAHVAESKRPPPVTAAATAAAVAAAAPPTKKHAYNEVVPPAENFAHPVVSAMPVDVHRRALERQEWFHGRLDRQGAEAILRSREHGAYLVRESGDSFTLSFKNEQELNHMKIKYENDRYILGARSRPFESVMEMLLYYTTHELQIRGSKNMNLGKPVPRI